MDLLYKSLSLSFPIVRNDKKQTNKKTNKHTGKQINKNLVLENPRNKYTAVLHKRFAKEVSPEW